MGTRGRSSKEGIESGVLWSDEYFHGGFVEVVFFERGNFSIYKQWKGKSKVESDGQRCYEVD
jgi:hypothetical protein